MRSAKGLIVGIRTEIARGSARGRLAFAGWIFLYLLWFAISPRIVEAMGRREQAGFMRFFMLYLTLWPGIVVGALGMLVPQRVMAAFAAVVSLAHLLVGLGYFP